MRIIMLSLVILLPGCTALQVNPGNVVDPVDPNNCAVRAVHIDAEANALGYASGRIDGTQVTFMNMKACPGLQLALPSPRDSSKVIGIVVPDTTNGAAISGAQPKPAE